MQRVAITTLLTAVAWWLLVGLCLGEQSGHERSRQYSELQQLFNAGGSDRLFSAHGNLISMTKSAEGTSPTEESDFGIVDGGFNHRPEQKSSSLFDVNRKPSEGMVSQISAAEDTSVWQDQLESDESSGTLTQQFSAPHQKNQQDNGEWQVLPRGLLYRSYLAGYKESRMQWISMYDMKNKERIWEATLGGRAGLLRKGSTDSVNPEGFQLDLEGAVFARVLPDEYSSMLAASDYRVGILGTWRSGRTAYKTGYYHISSHVGDEFLIANPTFRRRNYVRDSLITGITYDLTVNTQVYGEVGLAAGHQGGADWLEFQYGVQYAPPASGGLKGAPFAAVNSQTRQDFDWITGINCVAGWGWQGVASRQRLRLGLQYYTGPSQQYIFLNRQENLLGGGIWFDF
jgi:hypothetical protein